MHIGELTSYYDETPFAQSIAGIAELKRLRHEAVKALRQVEAHSPSGAHMHPFSILTFGIFVAGYITARWDLVTRLYELAIFAWDHGVFVRLLARTPRPFTDKSYRREPPKDSPFSPSSSRSS
jgi:hypothetical protein